ncbi:DnaT-like ssDNA-binding protein [Oceaniglobus ichthyenteri]|uniref:DnaT-like ssDNA-binding protein n=1 Tax=Oceaniglobus ichthyenteri TaxID=2136177 RepID=UPI000D332975|nr:DnaT-like ssDNA-binding protein [Oceaniglobus ichthyenteri]
MLSYIDPALTLAEADAYAVSRGYAAWVGDDTVKEAALRRGQDYIASKYNGRWLSGFTDATAPDAVKFAITEAAIRDLGAPGSLAPDYTPGKVVKRERVKAGPVESEEEYRDDGSVSPLPVFSVIDGLLRDLIYSPGPAIFVV